MVEITRVIQVPRISADYDAFLFATIGVDPNGNGFSVLSAMARMNLDPWREAASLAALPGKAAARKLASLIAAVPGGPAEPGESDVTATRLVKLLPSQTRSLLPPLPPKKTLLDLKALTQSPQARYVLFGVIALLLFALWSASKIAPSAPPPAATHSQTTQPADRPASTSRR
jgi:hypothetical protein